MIVKAMREGLGRLIVLGDFLTRPGKIQRSPEEQENVNKEAASLSLYQFYACPFCVKIRRVIHRLNIPIEIRDAQKNHGHRQTLQTEGGAIKVPCLRIDEENDTTWMYKSSDIISYLNKRFDATGVN